MEKDTQNPRYSFKEALINYYILIIASAARQSHDVGVSHLEIDS